MVFTIAARELRSLFLSPLAWVILAVIQVILAWMFLSVLETYIGIQDQLAMLDDPPGVTEIIAGQLLANTAVVLLLVAPLLTMRLISEELRSGTIALLFSAPISMTEIVLGKFFGMLGFLLVILGLVLLMPLSLMLGTDLDFGLLASGMLGLTLLLASFAAAGLFVSTLTNQPTVAAIGTFGLLLVLWIIDWAAGGGADTGGSIVSYLSLSRHHQALLKGLFDSRDIVYYLLFIATFLILSIRRLDAYRLQH